MRGLDIAKLDPKELLQRMFTSESKGVFRASSCILAGFTAFGQLFARDYRDLGVR